MAIGWGSYSNHLKLGSEVSISPSTVTSATTQVTVTVKWYVGTDGWDYSDTQTLTYANDDSGSTNFTNSLSGSHPTHQGSVKSYMLVSTRTFNISLNYGSTQSRSYKATLSGSVFGDTPTRTVSVTIPARPYAVPASPTGVNVSRVSDTQQTVTWTRNATSAAPYSSQIVQRNTFNGTWSGWANVATVSGTATSYSDNTTVADRAYDYRLVAVNSSGSSSASAASGTVYTSPAKPTNLVAVKNNSNNIELEFNKACKVSNVEHVIEHSANGGAYALLATVTAESYVHTSPNLAQTHTYRVKNRVDNSGAEAGDNLESAYSTVSNTVQLAAPPNAPSGLVPNGPTQPIATSILLDWNHNPTDSSAQRKYQLRVRKTGDPSFEESTIYTSSTSSRTLSSPQSDLLAMGLAIDNGNTLEWGVRTWGSATTGGADGTGASAWSATATVVFRSIPTVTINLPTPAEVLTTSSVVVDWTYYQAESSAQSSWSAQLLRGGVVVATKGGSGTTASTDFAGLDNATTYTARLVVTSVDGLVSAEDTVSFSTDFLPPVAIDASANYFPDSASVAIQLTPQEVEIGVTVEAAHVTIERAVGTGPWVVIAEDVPPDSSVVDTKPTINGINRYRLTVYSATPSARVQDRVWIADTPSFDPDNLPEGALLPLVEGTCEYRAILVVVDNGDATFTLYEDALLQVAACEKNISFLTTGPAFDEMVAFVCEARLSVSTSREKSVHNFAGRDWPLEMATDRLSQSVTVSTSVAGERDSVFSIEALEALALSESIVLWRDPTGRRMFGSLGAVNAGQAHLYLPHVWNPGFTVRRVDHDG